MPDMVSSVAGKIDDSGNASLIRSLVASNIWTLGTVVIVWAIVAVIATTTVFIALRGDSIRLWLQVFGPMVLYYSVWAVLSLLIYRVVEVFSGTRRRVLTGIAVHVLLFLVITLTLPFLVHYSDWQSWLYGARAPGFHALGAVIYLLNLFGSLLIRFYRLSIVKDREARDARLRSSLLENQLNLARMDALKMQINPHFLFNSLNSIAALIETSRNVEAYHTTELLGGLLRSALDQSSDRFLPLQQELEFVRRYVDVEKVRFGSRIAFDVQVDEDCREREVPALILQPIIENSIKHAVNRTADVVTIVLRAAMQADAVLKLELYDNGPGIPQDNAQPGGYGLSNISRRLELMYHGAARLDVSNRDQGGVCVTLLLPDLGGIAIAAQ